MVYFVLILRLSEIRQTVLKLMDIARVIKSRRTVHGNTISTITRIEKKMKKRMICCNFSLLENIVVEPNIEKFCFYESSLLASQGKPTHVEHSILERHFCFPQKHFILELCVWTFTCVNVYVILATLACIKSRHARRRRSPED